MQLLCSKIKKTKDNLTPLGLPHRQIFLKRVTKINEEPEYIYSLRKKILLCGDVDCGFSPSFGALQGWEYYNWKIIIDFALVIYLKKAMEI